MQAGEQREWLQVTLAAIGDGVIATDAAGRVRFLNAGGAAPDRLARRRGRRPADRRAAAALRRAQRRSRCRIAARHQRCRRAARPTRAPASPALRARDGKRARRCDVNAAPIVDADDGVAGAVLVLREAAAQRQAERAMREAYTELDERVVRRTAALERASAALRERNALLNAITTSTPGPDLRQGPRRAAC